jgi:hypothetical protein
MSDSVKQAHEQICAILGKPVLRLDRITLEENLVISDFKVYSVWLPEGPAWVGIVDTALDEHKLRRVEAEIEGSLDITLQPVEAGLHY